MLLTLDDGMRNQAATNAPGVKERDALATQIGTDGFHLLTAVEAATTIPWLKDIPAVATLREVWAQQFTDPPEAPRLKEAKERAASAELICSPYDIEARFSTRRSFSWVGYRVHLTETCDRSRPYLITDVLTTQATSPDENKLPVIQAALKERNLLPKEHLVDAGYTDAGVRATSQHEYGVIVTGPVTPDPSWQLAQNTGFDKTQFVIDWEAQVVTCPAGKKSYSWLPSNRPQDRCTYSVRFAKKDCHPCPHRRRHLTYTVHPFSFHEVHDRERHVEIGFLLRVLDTGNLEASPVECREYLLLSKHVSFTLRSCDLE